MAKKVLTIDFEGTTFKANRAYLEQMQAKWFEGGERFIRIGKTPEVYIDLVEFSQMKHPNSKEIVKCLRS